LTERLITSSFDLGTPVYTSPSSLIVYHKGYFYAFCQKTLTDTVSCFRSTNGVSWTEQANLFSCDAKSQLAVISDDNYIWIFYSYSGYFCVRRCTQNADKTLNVGSQVTIRTVNSSYPTMPGAAFTTNRIYAFVINYDGSNYRIQLSYSSDNGSTWTNILNDNSTLGGGGNSPSFAIAPYPESGSDAIIAVAGKYGGPFRWNIYNGSSWGTWSADIQANEYTAVGIAKYNNKYYWVQSIRYGNSYVKRKDGSSWTQVKSFSYWFRGIECFGKDKFLLAYGNSTKIEVLSTSDFSSWTTEYTRSFATASGYRISTVWKGSELYASPEDPVNDKLLFEDVAVYVYQLQQSLFESLQLIPFLKVPVSTLLSEILSLTSLPKFLSSISKEQILSLTSLSKTNVKKSVSQELSFLGETFLAKFRVKTLFEQISKFEETFSKVNKVLTNEISFSSTLIWLKDIFDSLSLLPNIIFKSKKTVLDFFHTDSVKHSILASQNLSDYPVTIKIKFTEGQSSGDTFYAGDFKGNFHFYQGSQRCETWEDSRSATEATYIVSIPQLIANASSEIRGVREDILYNQMKTKIAQCRKQPYGSYQNGISFSVGAAKFKMDAPTTYTNGDGYIFFSVPKHWIKGKYLRFKWEIGSNATNTQYYRFRLLDGKYERHNSSDFPGGGGFVTKGLGVLYSINKGIIGSGVYTEEVFCDIPESSEDYVTIFFWLRKAGAGITYYLYVDWIEINEGSGGQGNIFYLDASGLQYVGETTGDTEYGLMKQKVSPEPTHGYWQFDPRIIEEFSYHLPTEVLSLSSLVSVIRLRELVEALTFVIKRVSKFSKSVSDTFSLVDFISPLKGRIINFFETLSFSTQVFTPVVRKVLKKILTLTGITQLTSFKQFVGSIIFSDEKEYIELKADYLVKKLQPFEFGTTCTYAHRSGNRIFVVLRDTTVSPWVYRVAVYHTDTGIWSDAYQVGTYTSNDTHYDARIIVRPDGKLVLFRAYYTNYVYEKVSTYSVNDNVDDETLLTNWGSWQQITASYDDICSYPDPIAFDDRILVFYRYNQTTIGKWAMLKWTAADGWSRKNLVTNGDNGLYAFASKDGNYVFLSCRTYAGDNKYLMYSNDKGDTWFKPDGTQITSFPVALNDIKILDWTSGKLDYGVAYLDRFNHPVVFYMHMENYPGSNYYWSYYPANIRVIRYSKQIGQSGGQWIDSPVYVNGEPLVEGFMTEFSFSRPYKDPRFGNRFLFFIIPNMQGWPEEYIAFLQKPFSHNNFFPIFNYTGEKRPRVLTFRLIDAIYPYLAIGNESFFDKKIGSDEEKPNWTGNFNGYIIGTKFTAPETITVSEIIVRIDSSFDQTIIQGAIYDSNLNLLCEGSAKKISSTQDRWNSWAKCPVPPTVLNKGSTYWLCVRTNSDGTTVKYNYSSGQTNQTLAKSASSFPDPLTGVTYYDWELQIIGIGRRAVVRGLGAASFERLFTQTLNLVDFVIPPHFKEVFNEAIYLSAFLNFKVGSNLSETLSLISSKTKSLSKSLLESLGLSSVFGALWSISLYSAINLIEGLKKRVIKPLSSQVSLIGSISTSLRRKLLESITFSTLLTLLTVKKMLESFSLTASILTRQIRGILETLVLTDSVTILKGFYLRIYLSLKVSPSISLKVIKKMTETISASDHVLAGILVVPKYFVRTLLKLFKVKGIEKKERKVRGSQLKQNG